MNTRSRSHRLTSKSRARRCASPPTPDAGAALRPTAWAHAAGVMLPGGRQGAARLEEHGEVLERHPLHVIEGGKRTLMRPITCVTKLGWLMSWDLDHHYASLSPEEQRATMRRLGVGLKKFEQKHPSFWKRCEDFPA